MPSLPASPCPSCGRRHDDPSIPCGGQKPVLDADPLVRTYLRALTEADVPLAVGLFAGDAVVHSPLYGPQSPAAFYPALFGDTGAARLTLRSVMRGTNTDGDDMVSFFFHFDWRLPSGAAAPFDVVDVARLDADGLIAELRIVYDTVDVRPIFDRERGRPSWRSTDVAGSIELEPLTVEHAEELVGVLFDPELHTFMGGEPLGLEQLRIRYARLVGRRSPDGTQEWLNWVVRRREDRVVVGTVQATVQDLAGVRTAEVAWVVGTAHQGRGYARESAAAMVGRLRVMGVRRLVAHIHPAHAASAAVARALGLVATEVVVGGETRWVGDVPDHGTPTPKGTGAGR